MELTLKRTKVAKLTFNFVDRFNLSDDVVWLSESQHAIVKSCLLYFVFSF